MPIPHLISPPGGGQVGEAAAGHRAQSLPDLVLHLLLLLLPLPPRRAALLPPPALPEPGEGDAGGHGGGRARRRHPLGGVVRQVAVGPPPAENARTHYELFVSPGLLRVPQCVEVLLCYFYLFVIKVLNKEVRLLLDILAFLSFEESWIRVERPSKKHETMLIEVISPKWVNSQDSKNSPV